jgi:paraquat-inducible protein B
MGLKIIHEIRFGKDGNLDEAVKHFLNSNSNSNPNSEQLNLIIQKLDQVMANQKEFQEAFKAVDDATSRIATNLAGVAQRISGFEERIKQLGLDASVEDEVLSRIRGLGPALEQTAASLDAMAKDTSNPVPVDPGNTDTTTTTTTEAPTTTTTTEGGTTDTTTVAPTTDTTTLPPTTDTTTGSQSGDLGNGGGTGGDINGAGPGI